MPGLANCCCCRGNEAARRGTWRWRDLGTSSRRRGVMQRRQTRQAPDPGRRDSFPAATELRATMAAPGTQRERHEKEGDREQVTEEVGKEGGAGDLLVTGACWVWRNGGGAE